MDGDEIRIEQLEQRIRHLEARLTRVERGDARGRGSSIPAPLATTTWRPPTPSAAGRTGEPRAPGAIPGWTGVRVPLTLPPHPAAAPRGTVPGWGSSPQPAARAATVEEPGPVPEAWVPRPPISLRDLEERFAGRALAWVGGFALVAAAIFFLSLAFSRGWINEPMRVFIGVAVGGAAFGLGTAFLARANALMGNVLTGVGLGIFSIALFAATRGYGLVPPEVGLACALLAATAAAVIAIRFNTRVVAAYGLIAALVAPPVVGAAPNLVTLGFVAVTLAGTTAIALFKSWRWLPAIAFVLAAPQLASWVTGHPVPVHALVALAGFWLINIVAAGGEEGRIRRDDLRSSSATLVLANAAFLLWGGLVVLSGSLEPWRGTFVALASLAHLVLAGWFLGRQGLEHLFGNLVGGTGVALLAIAAFLQLGAPVVPLAWAAEAVALTWLAVRRRHRWSTLAALILAAMTVSHLLILEYPVRYAGIPAHLLFATPFAHPEAASLAATLVALAVAVVIVPVRWVRSAMCALGVLLAAYAVTFELTGAALAATLMALATGGLVLDRIVDRLRTDESLSPIVRLTDFGWFASLAGALGGAMAVALLLATEYPPHRFGELFPVPFQHPEAASLAVVLAGLALIGVLIANRRIRSGLVGVAILLVAWALNFELRDVSLVATLAVLLPAGVILDRALGRLPDNPRFAPAGDLLALDAVASAAGVVAWVGGAGVALVRFLDPTAWGSVTPPGVPFSDDRALVAGLLVAAALAAARWTPFALARRGAVVAAIAVAAWVVPFEVYADGVVVLWVALAALAVLAIRLDARSWAEQSGLAGLLGAGALLVAFGIVATPDRLWVVDPGLVGRATLLSGWPLAFAALALGAFLAPRHAPVVRWRTWFELAAGAVVVYLVSVAVVDVFQRAVGGTTAPEELAKQAQVALSVTWTTIGAAALVIGLSRRLPLMRHAGFALLGLASIKVFVIDLAAMDVAYRALVLAGLGLLLLASAWLFTRLQGPQSGASGIGGGAHRIP